MGGGGGDGQDRLVVDGAGLCEFRGETMNQNDNLQQQDKRDIAKADEEVLKRVLCGTTDEKDFYYLTERLKRSEKT